MKGNNNIIFEPVNAHFRLIRGRVEFGYWFMLRTLYALDAEGRAWQKNCFAVVVGMLTIPAAALDLVVLIVAGVVKVVAYILRGLWSLVLYAAKVVINKLFGTALKWVTIVLIILILYLKWDEITAILRSWHL